MTVAEQIETRTTRPERSFHRRIREATMVIDCELGMAKDFQYREKLVKAAYSLRNLEDQIMRQTFQ